MPQCLRKDIDFSADGGLGMDDNHMLIVHTAKTAKGRWILILQGFILDLDIQPAGKIFKLDQELFTIHGFGCFKCSMLLLYPIPLEGEGNGGRGYDEIRMLQFHSPPNPLRSRKGEHRWKKGCAITSNNGAVVKKFLE